MSDEPRYLSVIARGADQVERDIRQRERETMRWLHEKRWLAGKRLSDTVRRARRLHSESIARQQWTN